MPTPPTDSFDMSTATPVAAGSLVSADRIGIVDMSGPTPVVATLGEFIKFYISPVSGIVKSNGSTLSAAVAGTDYLAPTGSGAGLTGIAVSQVSGALAAANNLSDVADGPAAAANLGLGTGDDVTFQSVSSTFSGDGSGLTGLNPGSLSGPVGVGFGGLGASNAASTGVPLFTAGVVTIVATSGTGDFIRAGSPAFTGTPTAPTPAPGTNTDQLATAAFVQAAVAGTSGSFPARPTLPATPAGLTGYHRLAGPAGLTRYPTVGESAAVDAYGTVGVGAGQIGPCAAFNGTNGVLHIGAKGGFNVCGAAAGSWTITFACRPDSWPGGVYTVVATQSADNARSWEIRAGNTGFFYFDWRDLSQTEHVSELSVPPGSVPAGSWTRVGITFNASNGELSTWINGTKINTVTTSGVFDFSTLGTPVNLPVVIGGQYNATGGVAGFPYWRLFTGRIEGFAVYSRVLTGAEQTALDTTDPTVPASGTTLFLDTPEAGDVSHPDGAGAGTFRAQGWWHGAGTPTGWEYTWGDPGTWQTFEPTVSGQTFTALIPRHPAAGSAQRTLAVRWSNDHAVASSAAAVGVGPVFVLAGQSNVTGAGSALQSCGTSPDGYTAARQTHDWRVRALSESGGRGIGYYGLDRSAFIGSLGGDNGSCWPLLGSRLMRRYGRPAKFVLASRGSTYITHWARDTTDARNPATSYGNLLLAWQRLPGAVRSSPLLLWWHGESDATLGTTQAAYQTALSAFVTNWHADTGGKVMIFRLQKIGAGADVGALIRAAQDAVVGSNAYAVAGPDLYANTIAVDGSGVHVTSSAELERVAALTDAAMAAAGY